MRACMLLAPWLATMTYACPHCIIRASVAGMAIESPKVNVMPRIRAPVPPPEHVKTAIALPRPPSRRANLLVFKDDAWRSADAMTPELVEANAEISDARISTSRDARGQREWEIESPITFKYRVREEADVLDPSSDVLLFGHLAGDAAALRRAKSRPLKRVVVVDETVYSLYGARIEAYFEHYNVETRMLVLPTTEENKNMDLVLEIARTIHDLGIDRRLDPVIAIGGGVCMDIVGFAASIYRRWDAPLTRAAARTSDCDHHLPVTTVASARSPVPLSPHMHLHPYLVAGERRMCACPPR